MLLLKQPAIFIAFVEKYGQIDVLIMENPLVGSLALVFFPSFQKIYTNWILCVSKKE